MLVAQRTILRQAAAFCDAATLVASFSVAYSYVGFFLHRNFASFANYAWLIVPIVPIWLICLREFGFYTSVAYSSRRELLERLAQTQFVAGLILLAVMYLTRSESVSRLLLQFFLIISFAMLAAQKFALRTYINYSRRRTPVRRRKVLLVAAPTAARHYVKMVSEHASMLADVIGVVTLGAVNGHFDLESLPPYLAQPKIFLRLCKTGSSTRLWSSQQ